MNRLILILAGFFALASVSAAGAAKSALASVSAAGAAKPAPAPAVKPVFNREPLVMNDFAALPLGAVEPQGWLRDQLQRMCDGMTGHLDELYPEVVGDNNAWLGGEGDTWERGPYWIDGLLPLAYIMKDDVLIAKVQRWVEAFLTSSREDGQIGNTVNRKNLPGIQRANAEDWWPRMVVLKILKQYYEATADPRVPDVLGKYFRYQLATLPSKHIDHWTFWGRWRESDNLGVVYWLYNITGEKYLLELGELIHSQAEPFKEMFTDEKTLSTPGSMHCVNLGQCLKSPVIHWQYSKDENEKAAPKKALATLKHTFGLPTGLWAGDEMLAFGDPVRGSEFCTAVEAMYSAEEMLKATGDPFWADYLERIAFNALPTQMTDDCDGKQYFQQTNQIACTFQERGFVSEHAGTDNVFGLLNGYPCCTCNLHQGWPKFTANLWYASRDGGLAALVYAPCTVSTTLPDGTRVVVEESTAYPFREEISFTVSYPSRKVRQARFPLYLRIPAWCKGAEISIVGEEPMHPGAGSTVRLDREWKKGDAVTLRLPMEVATSTWYEGAACIERGPLLYALKLNEKWERKEFTGEDRATFGQYYWEVTTDSPWNFGFTTRDLKDRGSFRVEEVPSEGYPWNTGNAPVRIFAKAIVIPGWTEYNGSAGPVCYYRNNRMGSVSGGEKTVELIPYGCTTLRICEFPVRQRVK